MGDCGQSQLVAEVSEESFCWVTESALAAAWLASLARCPFVHRWTIIFRLSISYLKSGTGRLYFSARQTSSAFNRRETSL